MSNGRVRFFFIRSLAQKAFHFIQLQKIVFLFIVSCCALLLHCYSETSRERERRRFMCKFRTSSAAGWLSESSVHKQTLEHQQVFLFRLVVLAHSYIIYSLGPKAFQGRNCIRGNSGSKELVIQFKTRCQNSFSEFVITILELSQ